jgi:hypothetical protein
MMQSTRWHAPIETSEPDANQVLSVSARMQLLDQTGSSLSPPAFLEYKGVR